MIIITHHNDKVVQLENESVSVAGYKGHGLLKTVLRIAKEHPDTLLIWVAKEYRASLNLDYFRSNNIARNTLHSFSPETNYMSNDIGYVEETLFINVNKNVKYPTWLMSDTVGATNSDVFNAITSSLSKETLFPYYLNAIAKLGMQQGLFCYSTPNLLTIDEVLSSRNQKMSSQRLFRFVRQHYKKRWLFLLPFQQLVFEKRCTFFYALLALFHAKHHMSYAPKADNVANKEHRDSIDVLIPTMGRKKYLYDVLLDLAKQTHLPQRVFLVEQNPEVGSVSLLDYLKDDWPFKIEHTFIHQTGACNARNRALAQVTSDWVFFADDDIRMEASVLKEALHAATINNAEALTFSCLQAHEQERLNQPVQWVGFGSGTSLVKTSAIGEKKFNMAYEHGHGEDGDFGMQLRNDGTDVIYIPQIQLMHLKAPMGGFRNKVVKEWEQDAVSPKPSPTVMCYKIKYLTVPQFNSYKFLLFVKFYKNQGMKNPFAYVKKMTASWDSSIKWAEKLLHKND
jgi:hypothetical protein